MKQLLLGLLFSVLTLQVGANNIVYPEPGNPLIQQTEENIEFRELLTLRSGTGMVAFYAEAIAPVVVNQNSLRQNRFDKDDLHTGSSHSEKKSGIAGFLAANWIINQMYKEINRVNLFPFHEFS